MKEESEKVSHLEELYINRDRAAATARRKHFSADYRLMMAEEAARYSELIKIELERRGLT